MDIYTVRPKTAWLHSILWVFHALAHFFVLTNSIFCIDVPGDSEADINVQEDETNNPSPTFCWCKRPDEGDLIYCDGPDCSIGWFHFPCVGIYFAPSGKWLCPDCQSKSFPKIRDQARIMSTRSWLIYIKLTYCMLFDSSSVICWMSLFVI